MKFQPGDRVVMTDAAIYMGLQEPENRRTGVVVRTVFVGSFACVDVRRDGDNHNSRYAASFWQHAEPVPFSPAWLEARALAALLARE